MYLVGITYTPFAVNSAVKNGDIFATLRRYLCHVAFLEQTTMRKQSGKNLRASSLGESSIKYGWLEKKSTGAVFSRWQKRYFVVSGHYLKYFLSDDATEAGDVQAAYDLKHVSDVTVNGHEFQLQADGQAFFVRADSAEVASQWVAVINDVRSSSTTAPQTSLQLRLASVLKDRSQALDGSPDGLNAKGLLGIVNTRTWDQLAESVTDEISALGSLPVEHLSDNLVTALQDRSRALAGTTAGLTAKTLLVDILTAKLEALHPTSPTPTADRIVAVLKDRAQALSGTPAGVEAKAQLVEILLDQTSALDPASATPTPDRIVAALKDRAQALSGTPAGVEAKALLAELGGGPENTAVRAAPHTALEDHVAGGAESGSDVETEEAGADLYSSLQSQQEASEQEGFCDAGLLQPSPYSCNTSLI